MSGLLALNLVFAALAVLAPAAHVLELPNKLALEAPLWLAVQQHLYNGWGPAIGAPTELGALATTLALVFVGRPRQPRPLRLIGVSAYAGMIAAFFILNDPVNAAVSRWTAATLPEDWPAYRLRWEAGHALAALLSVVGLMAAIRAALITWRSGALVTAP